MDLIKIKIQNWAKFNPRADRANYTWFRFQNDFFHDEKIFSFNHEQISVYLFLLCSASKKNSDEFDISLSYGSAILKLKAKDILKYINDFKDLGMIAASSRHEAGEPPALLPATYVRTNVTEQDAAALVGKSRQEEFARKKGLGIIEKSKFNFQEIYDLYPNKEGKISGINFLKANIISQESFEKLRLAVLTYKGKIKKEKVGKEYVKSFGNFVRVYEDYLPENLEQKKPQNQPAPPAPRLERAPDDFSAAAPFIAMMEKALAEKAEKEKNAGEEKEKCKF